MDLNAEVAELRDRVAALEAELKHLRSFLVFTEAQDEPGRQSLHIRCTELHLCDPHAPGTIQGALLATSRGPMLAFYADGESRLAVRVDEGRPSVSLFTPGPQPVAEMGLDDNGRAYVGVLDNGKPRAIMKSTAAGGVVTVSHDDGQPRAFLRSEFTIGELFIVNADMKTVVKLSSAGPHGEGFVSVNYANGRPAAIMSATEMCGAVVVNDPRGQAVATLPAEDQGEDS